MEQDFTVKGQGTNAELHGDPGQLTLRKALTQWSSKKGVSPTSTSTYGVRVNGRTYEEKDFNKSFSDLGISPGDTIEIVEAQTT